MKFKKLFKKLYNKEIHLPGTGIGRDGLNKLAERGDLRYLLPFLIRRWIPNKSEADFPISHSVGE